MSAKHTPGPWQVSLCDDGVSMIHTESDVIGFGDANKNRSDEPSSRAIDEANVRLMAAAPNLLDTLKIINRIASPGTRTMDEMIHDLGRVTDFARAAIANATGETGHEQTAVTDVVTA
jgi:hypothetical protein